MNGINLNCTQLLDTFNNEGAVFSMFQFLFGFLLVSISPKVNTE